MPRNVANFHVRRYFNLSLKNLLLRTAAGPIEGHPRRLSRVERKGATKVFKYGRKTLSPVLENFGRAFSLDPTDCPWVSEDDWRLNLQEFATQKHCYTKVVKNCRGIFDDDFTTFCSTNSEIKKRTNQACRKFKQYSVSVNEGFRRNNHSVLPESTSVGLMYWSQFFSHLK